MRMTCYAATTALKQGPVNNTVDNFNHKAETSKCWCKLLLFLPTAATDSGFEHGLCQFQQHCTENCSVVFEPLIAARNTPR